jgi:hypothetical protein
MIGGYTSIGAGPDMGEGRRSPRARRALAGASTIAMLVAGLLPNAEPVSASPNAQQVSASPIAAMAPGVIVDSDSLAQMMPRFVRQPKL